MRELSSHAMRPPGILLGILLIAASSHAATLLGTEVTISREIPSESFLWGPVPVLVTGEISDRIRVSDGENMAVQPQSESILFVLGPEGGAGGGAEDHRIVVSNIHWFGQPELRIASISVTSDLDGFDPEWVAFDANSVSLWLGSLEWNGGERWR